MHLQILYLQYCRQARPGHPGNSESQSNSPGFLCGKCLCIPRWKPSIDALSTPSRTVVTLSQRPPSADACPVLKPRCLLQCRISEARDSRPRNFCLASFSSSRLGATPPWLSVESRLTRVVAVGGTTVRMCLWPSSRRLRFVRAGSLLLGVDTDKENSWEETTTLSKRCSASD